MKFKLKIGDKVELVRPVKGRYSGYGGRPVFEAQVGAICTVVSGPHPAVTGRERDFYCASVDGWEEGLALWEGDGKVKS